MGINATARSVNKLNEVIVRSLQKIRLKNDLLFLYSIYVFSLLFNYFSIVNSWYELV